MKKIKSLLSSAIRRGPLWATVHFSKSYQPVGEAFRRSRARPDSAFATRLAILEAEIQRCEARNMLDVGCAEGFFIRQAALRHALFAVGIDMQWKRIRVGAALAELNREEGYGYVPQMLTPEKLCKLPKYDIVLCHSVLHHVIRKKGKEEGLDFLKACKTITNKTFIFDMGGPEEVSQSWARDVAFLRGDVVANTKRLLQEAGFTNIRHVGESLGYRSEAMRPIFACQAISAT